MVHLSNRERSQFGSINTVWGGPERAQNEQEFLNAGQGPCQTLSTRESVDGNRVA